MDITTTTTTTRTVGGAGKTSLLFSLLIFCSGALAAPELFPFKGLQQSLAFWGVETTGKTLPPRQGRPIKIAVLDKTFLGYEKELGKSLPAKTRYFEGPVVIQNVDPSAHGLRMAQLMSFIATQQMRQPERIDLRLYRTAGFTNFKAAIQAVIDWKADLVLHSEVWEVGGNYDGKGFLNSEVSRAAQAGIIWVNAAGNYEGLAQQAPIRLNENNEVILPGPKNRLEIICRASDKRPKCPLRALLTWNSFTDSTEDGVEEDLNFELLDSRGKVLVFSNLKQTTKNGEAGPGFSKFPRESFNLELESGTYSFRITAATRNFTEKQFYRLSIMGDQISLPYNVGGETMMNPADNLNVLTVGALDSERSSVSLRMGKPDIWFPSSVIFEDGNEFRGSSNSAAFVAGLIALKKSSLPELTKQHVLQSATRWSWETGSNLSVNELRFQPRNGHCFEPANPAEMPKWARRMVSFGAKWVATTEGNKLMVPYDPFLFTSTLKQQTPWDRLLLGQRDWSLTPREQFVPDDYLEVFQKPYNAGLCRSPEPASGRTLLNWIR